MHDFTVSHCPFLSDRQRLSCDSDDCLDAKWEDHHNCSVLCCISKLCTVTCIHIQTVLTDDWWFRFSFTFLFLYFSYLFLAARVNRKNTVCFEWDHSLIAEKIILQ